jgi:hypothetical protein
VGAINFQKAFYKYVCLSLVPYSRLNFNRALYSSSVGLNKLAETGGLVLPLKLNLTLSLLVVLLCVTAGIIK